MFIFRAVWKHQSHCTFYILYRNYPNPNILKKSLLITTYEEEEETITIVLYCMIVLYFIDTSHHIASKKVPPTGHLSTGPVNKHGV
jgi:hypothetical protein